MRLFFALTFEDEVKRQLSQYRARLADHALQGNFTREVNFHLTLAFIGQSSVPQSQALTDILYALTERISCPPVLEIAHLGAFKRKSCDLIWLSIAKEQRLMQLQKQLMTLLATAGYPIDKRNFTPHITLGRNIVMRAELSELLLPTAVLPVRSLALMESKQQGGKLVYEVIDEISLS